jgi:hypothetical protein
MEVVFQILKILKILAHATFHFFESKKNIPPLSPRGWGAFPPKLFHHFSSSAHTNFHNPRSTPSGRKVREGERRENNSVNRGHYVCHAACLQQRTGSRQAAHGQRTGSARAAHGQCMGSARAVHGQRMGSARAAHVLCLDKLFCALLD